jgi:hypothetical protein
MVLELRRTRWQVCPVMGLAFLVLLWDSPDGIKWSDDLRLGVQLLLYKAALYPPSLVMYAVMATHPDTA